MSGLRRGTPVRAACMVVTGANARRRKWLRSSRNRDVQRRIARAFWTELVRLVGVFLKRGFVFKPQSLNNGTRLRGSTCPSREFSWYRLLEGEV